MFKKIKYEDGRREIYIGKKKIFEYVRNTHFAHFVAQSIKKLDLIELTNDAQSQVVKLAGGGGRFMTLLSC